MADLTSTRPLSLRRLALIPLSLLLLLADCWLEDASVKAQGPLRFQETPSPMPRSPRKRPDGNAPMLVQATEVQYDYVNKRVSAVGNVQIYHKGSTLEADRVIYEETTKRLHAEGNVRLTDVEGQVIYGEIMDLSDDFRDGFVDSLRLDTASRTRFAASRADRSDSKFTVFQSGVYTACEPCKDDPKKPPRWQIKGTRIIHDEGEKMIYFENAQFEVFGTPIAYLPYFSIPDPTVKRKSGFLMPTMSYDSKFGFGVSVPYYWALAPNYDLTVTPLITTKQGPLLSSEWRHRLDSGYYSIRASGIWQLDKEAFNRNDGTVTPGYRTWRGSLESTGRFSLSDKWTWGWDTILPSDATYYQDYHLSTYQRNSDLVRTGLTEGITQIFLTGKGDRSFFDIRSIYYYGFSESDVQKQIPVIHPVVDYTYVFKNPIFGGEVTLNANLTSLTRTSAAFDLINIGFFNANGNFNPCRPDNSVGLPQFATPANCVLRGIQGTYTRASTEVRWQRTFIDSMGQVFTPFATLRGDAAALSIQNSPAQANFGFSPGDSAEIRAMPAVGIEYRYPFINVQSWGTQTLEPIAQVILRPNEMRIGKFPNEDAQSLVFDDSNLFSMNKFSGWDRVEGGGRANVGLQYTAQINRAGFLNAVFGQSYQLFGTNSFAVGDMVNTGLGSGLDKSRSDYVARLSFRPDSIYTFATRYRFDESTWELRRFEAEAKANIERWNVTVLYGHYAPQPELGFMDVRDGVLGQAAYRLTANWSVTGGLRYDFHARQFVQTALGVAYVDDCVILGVTYATSYIYSGNVGANHSVLVQLNLRTIGGNNVAQGLNTQRPN